MQDITLKMPLVAKCLISQCAYNNDNKCHAKAITIGKSDVPGCGTFCFSSAHSKRVGQAGVGACKVQSCEHNYDFDCTANAIEIGREKEQIKCLTFKGAMRQRP